LRASRTARAVGRERGVGVVAAELVQLGDRGQLVLPDRIERWRIMISKWIDLLFHSPRAL
jgi:hypothetical protein